MNISSKYSLEQVLLIILIIMVIMVFFYVTTPGLREVVRPYHCQFYQATGLLCPACGGTRALLHLFSGRFLLALKSNALAVLFFPVVLYGIITVFRLAFDRSFTPADIKIAPFLLWSILPLVIIFWLVRNLPSFSFLSPIH